MELEHKCILSWMETEANGVKNSRKRKNILPYVSHQLNCNGGMEAQDRRLRQILSDLKHQGLIGANMDTDYLGFSGDCYSRHCNKGKQMTRVRVEGK